MRQLIHKLRLVIGFVAILLLVVNPASAVDVPPAGSAVYIQTNGAGNPIGNGDWYSSNATGGGNTYHYIQIIIPCGWPAATPIHIDLQSPEFNTNTAFAGLSEEIAGTADNTQFEIYGPGTATNFLAGQPAPGTSTLPNTPFPTQQTYAPTNTAAPEPYRRFYTIAAPVTCGTYTLRSQVIGDDQNGWRLRVGSDNDTNPNNAPPANNDNPDGLAGTNDEITIGIAQTSYQHDVGNPVGTCTAASPQALTLYEYVEPGRASVTFNNFDMDGNVLVQYISPSGVVFNGTTSGGTVWNGTGATVATRVGNTILPIAPAMTVESGWWRIITCTNNHNQFIQEGQINRLAFYTQPPTPRMVITKDDGLTQVNPGQTIIYTINFTNNSNLTTTPGAATNVVIQDTIPANTTYVGCAINPPFDAIPSTCAFAAGVVTYTLGQAVNAGVSGSVTVTVQVNANATGTVVNNTTLNYQDGIGNPFPAVSASDTDNIPVPTNTPTNTATPIPTDTPTNTPTPIPTNTPTETATLVPTDTPTNTSTPIPTDTPTNTPTPIPTNTPTETATLVPTDTPTDTPTPISTNTPTETATLVLTDTPTDTPDGATETPVSTNTPGGATDTPTVTGTVIGATETPVSTNTPGGATETPTVTGTVIGATETPISTNTPVGPTETPTVTGTVIGATETPVSTNTPGGATETPGNVPTTPAISNDQLTQTAAILVADPFITKFANPPFTTPGEEVVWTITLTNPGDASITNVEITDTMPNEVEILSVSATSGAISFNRQEIVFTQPVLNSGQTVTLTIRTRVRDGVRVPFAINNTALFTGDNISDKTAQASVLSVRTLPATGETPSVSGLPLIVIWCLLVILGFSRRSKQGA